MRAVLPGKPRATQHAVCTARWAERRLVAYISGTALIILDRPDNVLQTIYHDEVPALDAVAIDEETGKIAVCSACTVFVYRPFGQDEGVLKWSLQLSFAANGTDEGNHAEDGSRADEDTEAACTLSWGDDEELLVGSTWLRLFDTDAAPGDLQMLWSRELANPVSQAQFCPGADLIASTAQYDRLVKIWRRIAFGSDEVQFDYSYLPHPDAVTGLHWRDTKEKKEEQRHVLYTLCSDQKVRIWAAMNPHGMQVLELWSQIDLRESIQPRYLEPDTTSEERYVFFVPAREFKSSVTAALQRVEDTATRPMLEHLSDISEQDPELCVVLDGKGHMCAWGMQNLGSKIETPTDVFNIVLVEGFDLFQLENSEAPPFASLINFSSEEDPSRYCVLVHRFGGGIGWLEGGIEEFFDLQPRQTRVHSRALWTGHEGSIKRINRTMGGEAIFSRTNDNEGSVWKQAKRADDQVLARHSLLVSDEHIRRTSVLDGGNFVANLHHASISLWDTRHANAKRLARQDYNLEGKPLCLLQLPHTNGHSSQRYLATISSELQGIVWEVMLPQTDTADLRLQEYCTFNLGSNETLKYVLPVDPAGSEPTETGFLDVFAQDVALSYTETGILTTWTAKLETENRQVHWLATATVSTGIESPALASGNSIRKIALVNSQRDGLTIWDTRDGQLEFEKKYNPSETISDLDWTSTPDGSSILAVGFPHKVVILAQIRYDYLDKEPAWSSIREIYIRELTPHPIGDSTWLGSGNLVIGAGNSLFMYDKLIGDSDDFVSEYPVTVHSQPNLDLFGLTSILNGPLVVFHPQFLAQCVLAGKLVLVQKVLVNLQKALKFYSDGESLDTNAIATEEEFILSGDESPANGQKHTHTNGDGNDEPENLTEELAEALNDNISHKNIPHLSSREQSHLADLVECVATAEKHRRSMDENGVRFLLFFRQHMLRKKQDPSRVGGISWREFAWAYHSGSQEILVDLVSKHFSNRMLWENAKESGMFMWMTDLTALRAQFEVIARNEYTKTDEKNPIDCSLYYLALKKKNVLVGLWRMATWHREQGGTKKLLANNFNDPKWQTTASKNAYALMGKHRFEYAAAFFLLADKLDNAVSICANQLDDLQLAIAVARVYGGDDCPELKALLEDRVLPRAASDGNRWLATWAFWMLGRRDMAVRALITPVYQLLDRPPTPTTEARSWLATDPAMVVLYKQLRDKSLQTLKGATEITSRAEWEFVVQIVRLYDRMGCDVLALDLVRNWEFLKQIPSTQKPSDEVPDPRKLLRRRSSLVVADMPIPKSPVLAKTSNFKQPPPSVFEEPSSNSLLDSFGF